MFYEEKKSIKLDESCLEVNASRMDKNSINILQTKNICTEIKVLLGQKKDDNDVNLRP